MNETQREFAVNLKRCKFLPGSPDKRFAMNMAARVDQPNAPELTAKQARRLTDLVFKYRGQIERMGRRDLCVLAAMHIAARKP